MDMASGAVRPTGLPSANVLYYEMNDGAWLCVRRPVRSLRSSFTMK